MMNFPKNDVLISKSRAFQIIETHASDLLVLEVVSDYYQDPALQAQHPSHRVPGFAQIRTERLETKPLWNLRADPHLQQVLAEYGLVPKTRKRIILFDTIQLACGTAQSRFDASARLFSILYYFGLSHVSIILDPGIHSTFPSEVATHSQDAIQRIISQSSSSNATLSQGRSVTQSSWIPKHPDHFINYHTMVRMLAGELGPYHLLDARSAEEHAGIYTGYVYVPLAGKIPTAESVVNGDYQVSAQESLPAVLSRLTATLERKGIAFDDQIVWYCGTGWRASRMCALTQALGYTNVAIYDGGWIEWQQHHPKDGREKPWGIEPRKVKKPHPHRTS